MPRPCLCDSCHLCHLYHTNPAYRAHWDAAPQRSYQLSAISYQPEKPCPALPIRDWPFLARGIARLRTAADEGLGDTIHRNLARFGADALARFYEAITGHPCGCADRRSALNNLFPYPQDQEEEGAK
jgi:hypothetical protein